MLLTMANGEYYQRKINMISNEQQRLIEWTRRLDPARFNKAQGAQYHTAPSIVLPDTPDYPKNVPSNSVTIMFTLSGTCWIGIDKERTTVKGPIFVEKPPKTKRAKHGPVVVMDEASAYLIVPTNENYYWACQQMVNRDVIQAVLKPGKERDDGKFSILCIVTFMPNEGEE